MLITLGSLQAPALKRVLIASCMPSSAFHAPSPMIKPIVSDVKSGSHITYDGSRVRMQEGEETGSLATYAARLAIQSRTETWSGTSKVTWCFCNLCQPERDRIPARACVERSNQGETMHVGTHRSASP